MQNAEQQETLMHTSDKPYANEIACTSSNTDCVRQVRVSCINQSINRYVQQDAENTLGAALRALARVGTRTADRLDVVGEHISQYAAEQLDDA